MAYRAIQDTVPHSTSLAKLSHLAGRMFFHMLAACDRCGRLPGEPAKIRALAVPLLSITDQEVRDALEELVKAGRVELGCVRGVWVCQVIGFAENQPERFVSGDKYSRLPAIPEGEKSAGLPPIEVDVEGPTQPSDDGCVAATSSAAEKRGRRRDPEWEALLDICGIDAASLTKSGRGALNGALNQLRAVGADADEIRRRAVEYRRRFSVPLTAAALAKHWASLGTSATSRGGIPSAFDAYTRA